MFRKALLAALLAALALTRPSSAAEIQSDVYDLRLDLTAGLDSDAYEFPPFSASLGYFPAPNLEFGGLIGLRKAQFDSYWANGSVWELGVFGEKHFNVKKNFHPLVGLRLSLLDGEQNDDTAYQAFLYGGGKVFLNEYVALVVSAGVTLATEDIYDVDRTNLVPGPGVTETSTTSGDSIAPLVDVGLRIYF